MTEVNRCFPPDSAGMADPEIRRFSCLVSAPMTNVPHTGPVRVYHLSPLRKAILLGVWVLFVLPLVVVGVWAQDPAALATGVLTGAILAAVFIPAAWWFPRLALSEESVSRRNVGYRLATSWDNVAELRLTRGSEGFVLRQAMDDAGARRFAAAAASVRILPGAFRLYPGDVLELITDRRFIPLESFAYWWKHGDLGLEIARHAPWLAVPGTGTDPDSLSPQETRQ
jgi:hypothetical protein